MSSISLEEIMEEDELAIIQKLKSEEDLLTVKQAFSTKIVTPGEEMKEEFKHLAVEEVKIKQKKVAGEWVFVEEKQKEAAPMELKEFKKTSILGMAEGDGDGANVGMEKSVQEERVESQEVEVEVDLDEQMQDRMQRARNVLWMVKKLQRMGIDTEHFYKLRVLQSMAHGVLGNLQNAVQISEIVVNSEELNPFLRGEACWVSAFALFKSNDQLLWNRSLYFCERGLQLFRYCQENQFSKTSVYWAKEVNIEKLNLF